ncbi:MAG: hypothetical protein EOO02_12365 [Chitinophagaceae bacterium]|nr:MAG: hypothetical protein EOO02_12365 [Chitinophagaceae bacterium]
MKMEHLSEELVQQLALEPGSMSPGQRQHLSDCAGCAARVADYKLLFSDLSDMPAPSFEFDLASMVMEKLPALHPYAQPASVSNTKDQPKAIPWMIAAAIAAIALMGLPFYYFRASITSMLNGLSTMITALAIIIVVFIAIFQVIDEYRKYNKRINSLNI